MAPRSMAGTDATDGDHARAVDGARSRRCSMSTRFEEVKRRFGAEQLRGLFVERSLVVRGSGRTRARCPQCQDSPREVSIREVEGVGLWKCHHCGIGGSAIDLLVHADDVDKETALATL